MFFDVKRSKLLLNRSLHFLLLEMRLVISNYSKDY